MTRQNITHICLFICLVPVGACAGLVALTFLVAAATSRGSDLIVWLSLGLSSSASVLVCLYALTRLKSLTFWRAALAVLLAVSLTAPGYFLLGAFAHNPP